MFSFFFLPPLSLFSIIVAFRIYLGVMKIEIPRREKEESQLEGVKRNKWASKGKGKVNVAREIRK